jgi:hypothetical protein
MRLSGSEILREKLSFDPNNTADTRPIASALENLLPLGNLADVHNLNSQIADRGRMGGIRELLLAETDRLDTLR